MRQRHLITAGYLLGALGFYYAGATSASALLLVGAGFELVFWVRLVRKPRQP